MVENPYKMSSFKSSENIQKKEGLKFRFFTAQLLGFRISRSFWSIAGAALIHLVTATGGEG